MQVKQLNQQNYWHWQSKSRFYSIRLQKNLFNEWTLLKGWGGLKNRLGKMKIETFNSLEEALREVSNIAALRSKRGYCAKLAQSRLQRSKVALSNAIIN